jgi:hypothetical protein
LGTIKAASWKFSTPPKELWEALQAIERALFSGGLQKVILDCQPTKISRLLNRKLLGGQKGAIYEFNGVHSSHSWLGP